jgi:hypothetical protein
MAEDPFGDIEQLLAAQPKPAPHVADPRWMTFLVKYYQKTLRTNRQAEEYLTTHSDKRYVIWPNIDGGSEDVYKFKISNKKVGGGFEHEYLDYMKNNFIKGFTPKSFDDLETLFPETNQGGGGKRRSRRRPRKEKKAGSPQ